MEIIKFRAARYITAAVVAALIVMGSYVFVFAEVSGFKLSRNPEDWSRFGEYVGGSLGATYGLLAFVGIVLTISDDRKKAAEEQRQASEERKTTRSTIYFQQAEIALRTAVSDFTKTTDKDGRPLNDRRHWLNFARGVSTAQKLSQAIEDDSLKEIWKRTEHYWRERVYDVLSPQFDSFPAEYYGHIAPDEQGKNAGAEPGERLPISEPSLVFVYRWIKWPTDLEDELDRKIQFRDDELEEMELFGPRGVARFIRILRRVAAANIPTPATPAGTASQQ
jgi:hypothetical protein